MLSRAPLLRGLARGHSRTVLYHPRVRRAVLDYAEGLLSLRGAGPRQAGARSAGVRVFCEVRSGGDFSGVGLALLPPRGVPFVSEPVSRGASASLKKS
jgi:hypothetical protein